MMMFILEKEKKMSENKTFPSPPEDKTYERVDLFPENIGTRNTEEKELHKRQIYEQMSPRRKKFIDRLGYDNWDPFQEPKEPMDIRKDLTKRTHGELINEFMKTYPDKEQDEAWRKGVGECALGIIAKDEKFQAIFDFCLWYYKLLKKEGYVK